MNKNYKQVKFWLLLVGAGSFCLALVSVLYAYALINESSASCVAGMNARCRIFVPWIWLAAASLILCAFSLASRVLRGERASRNLVIVLAGFLFLALAVALYFVINQSEKTDQLSDSSVQDTNRARDRTKISDRAREIGGAGRVSASSDEMGVHPFPEVPKSRVGLPLESDPFIATSAEEQAWLDRNGYPNEKQWAIYTQASDLQLRQAAALGDKAANGILLHRQLIAGNDSAIDQMINEGATGSAFALDMLASFLASNRGGDRVSALAISRVSEMRGNLRLAGARDIMFDRPLTSLERSQGEQEAIEIYNGIHQLQKKLRGKNSSPIDLRPVGK